jgi:hypothetical protein
LWQFWIALHCTLVRLPPPSPNPFPLAILVLLKAIIKYFIVPFPICIWSPSTIFSHLHVLLSLSPTHCIYFTVLSFIINSKVNIQRGFSKYTGCESLLLSLTPSLPPPIIWQLSANIHMSILLTLYHSLFLSLLPWVPQCSSTVTNILYM